MVMMFEQLTLLVQGPLEALPESFAIEKSANDNDQGSL